LTVWNDLYKFTFTAIYGSVELNLWKMKSIPGVKNHCLSSNIQMMWYHAIVSQDPCERNFIYSSYSIFNNLSCQSIWNRWCSSHNFISL